LTPAISIAQGSCPPKCFGSTPGVCLSRLGKRSGRRVACDPGRFCSRHGCLYRGLKEVGTWLNNILKKGGTEDWRKVLKEATGEDISTRAMMEYFKPLMSWLEEQNTGRQIGWE